MFLLGPRTGYLCLVMGLDMDIDTGPLDKGLVTVSARVRLLPGVQPLVVLPSPLGAEALTTKSAGLWLLPSMGPLVLFK